MERGRKYRRCQCPVWVDGLLDGEEINKSLRTQDWQKANRIVQAWEAEGQRQAEPVVVTIKYACSTFLEDATARNLREPTLYKYKLLFRRLEEFAQSKGIHL